MIARVLRQDNKGAAKAFCRMRSGKMKSKNRRMNHVSAENTVEGWFFLEFGEVKLISVVVDPLKKSLLKLFL